MPFSRYLHAKEGNTTDRKDYSEKTSGMGFPATANSRGEIDIAVYSKPKVMADGTLSYGMAERLTHATLKTNPHAVYAFHEGALDKKICCNERRRNNKTG